MYFFEFEVPAPPGTEPEQIKAKGYEDKYRAKGLPVWLLAVEFSSESRNVEKLEVERVQLRRRIASGNGLAGNILLCIWIGSI